MVENMSMEELQAAAKAQGMELPTGVAEETATPAESAGPVAAKPAAQPKVQMETVKVQSKLQDLVDKLHNGFSVDDVKKFQKNQKKSKGKPKKKAPAKKPAAAKKVSVGPVAASAEV